MPLHRRGGHKTHAANTRCCCRRVKTFMCPGNRSTCIEISVSEEKTSGLPETRRYSMRAFLLTSAILAFSTPVLLSQAAAQNVPAAAHPSTPEFIAVPGPSDIRLRQWIGVPVKNGTNDTVGDVNDLVFSSAGQIKAIVVGVGGLVGIAEKNVAVKFEDAELRQNPDDKERVV